MQTAISFLLDGRTVTIDFERSGLSPTTTVLDYLRSLPGHTGVKESCAEGDCGACTVVTAELAGNSLNYRAVDSCLLFLPMIHGKELITVENLKNPDGTLHPVQEALVEEYGSQCGFCTPGIVMSLYALYRKGAPPAESEIRRALAGNLCRCTGYRPIIDAAVKACGPARREDGGPARAIAQLRSIPRESIILTKGRQTYFRPATLEEALDLKTKHPAAVVTGGATDVALRVTKNHELLPVILDLSGIEELKKWSWEDGSAVVGSGTVMEDFAVLCRERFPAIAGMLDLFGSLQIRNLATLGGNLGTASPVGDLVPLLIAHRAKVVLRSPRAVRDLPAESFITGYRRTAAGADELISAVVIPAPPAGTLIRSYKVSRRRDVDIATVSAAFRLELDDARRVRDAVLAYGGMAESVRRAEKAERFLAGRPWDRHTVEGAMERIDSDFTPISDVRGSASMRRIAAQNLLLKFWAESTGSGGESWS